MSSVIYRSISRIFPSCKPRYFARLCKTRAHGRYPVFNESSKHTNQNTLKYHYNFWNQKFTDSGISEPRESIENILASVIKTNKISDVQKKLNLELDENQTNKIKQMCELRLKSMPIQYVIEEWDFRNLTLTMKPPVFIPRPETEQLVDIILKDLKHTENPIKILEICCGSGAISLALLKDNLNITITAVDQSPAACQLTAVNAGAHQLSHRLTILQSTVTDEHTLQEIDEKFDVIVSNPPYVPSSQVATVQPEIKLYEDLAALDGGMDGLSVIKPILQISQDKLRPGGSLYLETDPSHPAVLVDMLNGHPALRFMQQYKDIYGKDRFVKIVRCQ